MTRVTIRQAITRRPVTRRAMLALTTGAGIALLSGCRGGRDGWPKVDGRQNVAVSPAGISATELIWAFFAKHPRAGQ